MINIVSDWRDATASCHTDTPTALPSCERRWRREEPSRRRQRPWICNAPTAAAVARPTHPMPSIKGWRRGEQGMAGPGQSGGSWGCHLVKLLCAVPGAPDVVLIGCIQYMSTSRQFHLLDSGAKRILNLHQFEGEIYFDTNYDF